MNWRRLFSTSPQASTPPDCSKYCPDQLQPPRQRMRQRGSGVLRGLTRGKLLPRLGPRRGQRQGHGPPAHPVLPGQVPARQPVYPRIPADRRVQLDPRHRLHTRLPPHLPVRCGETPGADPPLPEHRWSQDSARPWSPLNDIWKRTQDVIPVSETAGANTRVLVALTARAEHFSKTTRRCARDAGSHVWLWRQDPLCQNT
jgi:hypothetical protein